MTVYKSTEAVQKAARDAIDVQDACNLTGVLNSFQRHMAAICESQPEMGTDARNRHPVAVLFINKMADLAGIEREYGSNEYLDAYAACNSLAAGVNVIPKEKQPAK